MNLNELPMITFTVLGQLSVGAFVVLGIVQLISRSRGRCTPQEVDRLTEPILYAVGGPLVLGLFASIFHMHDISHVLNVFRHVGSSWLSREIVFGMAFAGLVFLFAVLQWLKLGGARLRRVLAGITALVGLGLVYVMSMIYYTLKAVPAWHTWLTPVYFFTTTFLLGSLVVGTAMAATLRWPNRAAALLLPRLRARLQARLRPGATAEAEPERAADLTPGTRRLVRSSLHGIAVAATALLGVVFITVPMHISALSDGGPAAAKSAVVFSGAWFVVRLLLVFLGAGLLGTLLHRFIAASDKHPGRLAFFTATAFTLVLLSEFIGRAQFYESMFRVGM